MDIYQIVLFLLVIVLFLTVIGLFFYVAKHLNDKDSNKLNKEFLEFTNRVNDSLNALNNRTSDKISQLENSLNKNIIDTNKSTNEIFNKLNERLIKIDDTQKSLNELSNDIVSLESVLTDKKSRGTFGEVELYSILESTFGIDRNRFAEQYTLSNGCKADAVIFGPDSLGTICVDSKFPLENYRRMFDEELSSVDKEKAKVMFKADVLKHLNDIKTKYIIAGETAPMAYMFVPAEAVFAEIYGNFPEVIDKSYEAKVYIVSPTTLMAYLTAIRSIYLGQVKNDRAKEIETLLNDLSIEFTRFKDRQETLQKDFEKIIPDFEKVSVTSNKIIKRFSQINDGEIDE